MKKLVTLFLSLVLFGGVAMADSNEIPIKMHQLPDAARELVKKYFPNIQMTSAKLERGLQPSYEVVLADGTTIDFDSKGEWTDIERQIGRAHV